MKELLQIPINNFSCTKDLSVQHFLTDLAIKYEEKNKTRTYLILNEDELNNNKIIIILGYFSIALQVLEIPDTTSKTKIKKIDGLSSSRHDELILTHPVYLIGQIAKNDSCSVTIGKTIIDMALDIIKTSQGCVGGRIVLIECEEKTKLIEFYNTSGFEILQKDKNDRMLQLIYYI